MYRFGEGLNIYNLLPFRNTRTDFLLTHTKMGGSLVKNHESLVKPTPTSHGPRF